MTSGSIPARKAGAIPSTRSATGTISSGSAATISSSSTCITSTWRSGRWATIRSVRSAWADARSITEPEYGQSYDHFAIDYEFPNGVHVLSMARQIEGCASNVSETMVGSNGEWHSGGYRFTGHYKDRIRMHEVNPYVQEHIDLLESITRTQPINELKQVAESTLTAIMGRDSAYTGKKVSWDQALNSKLDTFPKESWPGARWKSPGAPSGRDLS